MVKKLKLNNIWINRWFYIGMVMFILGTLDPLEGSPLLLTGGILMARMQYLNQNKLWKWYRIGALSIVFGFVALHFLSYLGGFGPDDLAWGWALFLLPYLIGWLIFVLLFFRWIFNRN